MEYRLIVMRHAKSDWNTDATNDHERPLNKRGRRDAPKVAKQLVALGWEPTQVVSSDSRRTTETFELMSEEFRQQPSVVFSESLYHAGIHELEDALNAMPDECSTILALGHNPGWQDCIHRLTGEHESMTTANAALMSITAGSWAEAIYDRAGWNLVEMIRPRELAD